MKVPPILAAAPGAQVPLPSGAWLKLYNGELQIEYNAASGWETIDERRLAEYCAIAAVLSPLVQPSGDPAYTVGKRSTTPAEDAELLDDVELFLRVMHARFPDLPIGLELRATDRGISVVIAGPGDRADGTDLREALNRALLVAAGRSA